MRADRNIECSGFSKSDIMIAAPKNMAWIARVLLARGEVCRAARANGDALGTDVLFVQAEHSTGRTGATVILL